ncbi:unnamed protein product [Linum trigynum]|uniref:Uncharacterized protein n=1 Tax=Linum trigynum TaxID=586398 RepID=A0AAV2G900_9ROSI
MQILPRRVAPVQIPSSPRRLAQISSSSRRLAQPPPSFLFPFHPSSLLPSRSRLTASIGRPEQKEKKSERGEKKGLGDGGSPSRRKRKVREERRRVLEMEGPRAEGKEK